MEAFLAAFRPDRAMPPDFARHGVGGILYVEDFDAEDDTPAKPAAASPPVAPGFTQQDIDAARQQGYEAGFQSAAEEAASLGAQLRAAALQSLADGLANARADLRDVAERRADDLSGLILAALQAALPALSAQHASGEVVAVMRMLLPNLRCDPVLRIRVHPDLVETARQAIGALAQDFVNPVRVEADPAKLPGDIDLRWTDGTARRDCQAIWAGIAGILAPIGSPRIVEQAHAA